MENIQSNVVGKALYLELRNGSYTNQIIVMPEGVAANGSYVPTVTYRRRISANSPRKTWRVMSSLFRSERNPDGQLVPLGREHALATVTDRLGYSKGLFDQLTAGGYKIFKTTITVEVTKEDLVDAYNGKTPYKVIARITRSRKALNFGDALFTE